MPKIKPMTNDELAASMNWFEGRMDTASSDCWIWRGVLNSMGYGRISFQGNVWLAHRLGWSLFFGDIPDSMCVLHACDNRKCCNPSHLFIGTQQDNMDDMIAKGRARFRMMAKLSKQNVLDIVKECSAGATVCDVAKKYGVAHPTVSMIMCGQR